MHNFHNLGDGLEPGTRLQELEIVRELGSGGFGITYLARDLSLDRLVAVKEYLPRDWGARRADGSVGPRSSDSSGDYAWGLKRFLKEARILAGMNDRHIVRVYRIVEAHGTAYIVMEHVDGLCLRRELKQSGPFAEQRVRQLLEGLAAGLAVVHAAGLLHRDVTPGNVMLRREDGSPVLIDFGAARQHMGRQSRSLTAVLTPGYAPPEQYYAKGRQGPWTDVYALGAVAYEALSGRVPDEAPGRALDDELPPVEAVAASPLSGELAALVTRALHVDRARRPQDMTEFTAALHAGGPAAGSHLPADTPRSHGKAGGLSARHGAFSLASSAKRWKPQRWVWGAGLGAVGVLVLWMTVAERRGSDSPSAQSPATEMGNRPTAAADSLAAVEMALALDRSEVRLVQRGLLEAGFDPGADGGFMGRGTRNALRRWQASRGLERTGFLDADAAENLVELGRAAQRTDSLELAQRAAEARRADQAEAQRAADAQREAEARRLADLSRPGRTFSDCAACPQMIVIGPGSFTMGSPASEEGRLDAEGPQRRVTIAQAFALGVHEVTFDEWSACVRGGGCGGHDPGDEGWGKGHRPVINISWEDAKAYVSWLSRQMGEEYRLPSEAEWEYTARAGTQTARHWGESSSGQCGYANGIDAAYKAANPHTRAPVSCNDGYTATAPVGSYSPNAWGLRDMLGNVYEWTEDCRHDSYAGAPTHGGVWPGGDCSTRMLRGGSWAGGPVGLRSAARLPLPFPDRYSFVGFRVARTLK